MMTGLEYIAALLPWFHQDIEEGYVDERKHRWFHWGYITRSGERKAWYIVLRLPSYVMQTAYWRDGPPTWHQRVLIFKEKLPNGVGAWEMIEWECD